MSAEHVFEVIPLAEHLVEGRFVGLLCRREAGAVDAVVDRRVNAFVQGVDVRSQRLRVEVEQVAGQRIEVMVEHPHDLRRLVIDDAVFVLVPQHRHRHAASVMGIVLGVALVQVLEPIEVIAG